MSRPRRFISLLLPLFVTLAACSGAPTESASAPATSTPEAGPPQRGLAVVQSVSVAAPAQVTVRGTLGDACTQLAEIQVERTGAVFIVTVNTTRPAGAACAAVLSDFEKAVALPVAGAPAGEYTVVANGVSAALTLAGAAPTEAAAVPTATEPAPTAAPTEAAAVSPTAAPAPTQPPAPTVAPTAAPAAVDCVNKAAFDRDVTIPDRSVLTPGQKFVKTWRVQNAGTCVWQNYQLIFDNGDRMGAALTLPVATVKAGEYVELAVDMTAPAAGGSHIGRWQFQTPAGQRFGLSVPDDGLLWVWIDVPYTGAAAAASAGTSTSGNVSSVSSGGGACGAAHDAAGEAQLLNAINTARAQNGLGALNLNGQLNAAAWRHAQDMLCNGINSLNPHRGSDGTSFKERIQQAGFGGNANTARENVYYGGTPADAFDWWMNSQIHHDNILFPAATEIGVAYAVGAGSEWTNYYTLIFGQP